MTFSPNSRRISVLAFAAALGLSGAALAQSPPMPPPPPGAMGGMGDHPRGPHGMMAEHREMREGERLKALHDALNIRPDQEAAFAALGASMKPSAPAGGPRPGGMKPDHAAMAAMTTPERLDLMAQRMDERMSRMRERFERHATAVKALYAVLSPDQRHTLDALPMLMAMGGAGGGMGEGPHGPMGPHGGMGPHGDMERGMAPHPGQGE